MGEVVEANIVTRLNLPPDRVLKSAMEHAPPLTDAVVIGWDEDGEFYFASSVAAGPEVLWLLKQAEKQLLEAGQED